MIRSYDHLQVKLYTSERNSTSKVVHYFIQIIRCMFLSYEHLQVEIYKFLMHIFIPEDGRTTETYSG
jgi:hypothetical protein